MILTDMSIKEELLRINYDPATQHQAPHDLDYIQEVLLFLANVLKDSSETNGAAQALSLLEFCEQKLNV